MNRPVATSSSGDVGERQLQLGAILFLAAVLLLVAWSTVHPMPWSPVGEHQRQPAPAFQGVDPPACTAHCRGT